MPGVKITQLGNGGALQPTDAFPIARGDLTRFILGQEILNPLNELRNKDTALDAYDAYLLSLITSLSSNMDQIMNVPYVRAEYTSSSTVTIGSPPITDYQPLLNSITSNKFTSPPTLVSNDVQLPAGTYNFKVTTTTLYNTIYQNIHNIQWNLFNASNSTYLVRGVSQTVSMGTGALYTNVPSYNGPGSAPLEGRFTLTGTTNIGVRLSISSFILSWNSADGSVQQIPSFSDTPLVVLEFWKIA